MGTSLLNAVPVVPNTLLFRKARLIDAD